MTDLASRRQWACTLIVETANRFARDLIAARDRHHIQAAADNGKQFVNRA
jgi:hypothetical protein